jgi:hypothetical protein
MDALGLFGLLAVTAMLVAYALEDRSHRYILAFAGACALGSAYGFLQVPGRSGWSRRSGAASRCGAGASGGNNLAMAAQTGRKTLQGAVLMGAPAGDEERLDLGLRRAQRVDAHGVVPPGHGARQ